MAICNLCRGTGRVIGKKGSTCPKCEGTGQHKNKAGGHSKKSREKLARKLASKK